MASPQIQWEAASMANVGLDLNMFNNKLQSSVEYYIKDNTGLLMQIPSSAIFGRQDGNPWANMEKSETVDLKYLYNGEIK